MGVHIFQSRYHLDCVALDFKLMKPLSPSQEFIHGLTATQLKQDINVFTVFKEMLESHYMPVH